MTDGYDRNNEDPAYWEGILSSEGLSERIYKKQIRGKRGTPERAHAVQRETVVSPDQTWVWDSATPDASRRPESAMQALMETEPHDTPQRDKEASMELREALLDSVYDILDEETADLLVERYFAQTPIAELSARHGYAVSTLTERIQRAASVVALELEMNDTPWAVDYLNGEPQ